MLRSLCKGQQPLTGQSSATNQPLQNQRLELLIKVNREPGLDFYVMTFPDGTTAEVDAAEALDWFRERHYLYRMDEHLIGKALDDAWNFGSAEILIENARRVSPPPSRVTPKVGWE